MPELMTGGQALVAQLVREGADRIFGVPGVQLDWAVDPLIDAAGQIAFHVPRHEQATSYMADGYARTTGKAGLCLVVPGPGVLNAMAGLSTAYACSSPVLCIAGQIASGGIGLGRGALHEINDQSGILGAVTKWQGLARSPAEIPSLVREAFRQMFSGRQRPVAIEVPPDVLQATGDVTLLDPAMRESPAIPEPRQLEQAASLLAGARFPVIWAGYGVIAAGASAALAALAERLQAPVVMSENGRGALSDRHALALPALAARALFPHADVVLVVGSRFANVRGLPVLEAPGARFVYLNIDEADTTAPRRDGLRLIGDARTGLEHLAALLPASGGNGAGTMGCARVRAWCDQQIARIEPQLGWLRALRNAIPEDGVLVNELTQVGYLAPIAYPVYQPRTFVTPGYQGTLGYGFPTGLGAAAGSEGRVVVSISGDGGFGWNLQELATAAKYQWPLVSVVFNDGQFGNVRRIQQQTFGRGIGTDLHNPDFQKLAGAFGVDSVRVTGPDALEGAIREASQARSPGPLLIEVPVGEMPGPWHLLNTIVPPPHPAPPDPLAAHRAA